MSRYGYILTFSEIDPDDDSGDFTNHGYTDGSCDYSMVERPYHDNVEYWRETTDTLTTWWEPAEEPDPDYPEESDPVAWFAEVLRGRYTNEPSSCPVSGKGDWFSSSDTDMFSGVHRTVSVHPKGDWTDDQIKRAWNLSQGK